MPGPTDSYLPTKTPVWQKLQQHQSNTRYSQGPPLTQYPGTSASDFTWNADSGQWELNGAARPGYLYITRPQDTKDGKTGWVPSSDRNLGHAVRNTLLLGAGIVGGGALAGVLGGGGAAAADAVPSIATGTGVPAGIGASVPALTLPGAATAAGAAGAGTAAAAGTGAGTVAGTGASGTFSKLLSSPSVVSGGLNFLGGLFQGAGQAKMSQQELKARQQELALQALEDTNTQQSQEDLQRAQTGLSSTQMNPVQQAMDVNKANILRSVLSGAKNFSASYDPSTGKGSISGGLSIPAGGLDLSALDPKTLASAAQNFYSNAAQVQPNVPPPNLNFGAAPDGTSLDDTMSTNVSKIAQQAQDQINKRRQAQQQAIQSYLNGNVSASGGSGLPSGTRTNPYGGR